MKKVFASVILLLFCVVAVYAQGAKFQFTDKNDSYDFGTVNEGAKVVHVFEFKNVGDQPLMILHADASCGCTVPEWPKTPIAPGKTGSIKVTFNSEGKAGPAMKEIFLKSNAVMVNKNQQRYSLYLKGNVTAKK